MLQHQEFPIFGFDTTNVRKHLTNMTQTITETPVYVFRDWEERRRYEAMTDEVREEYEKEHGVPIGPLPDVMGPADPQNEAGPSQLPSKPITMSTKKGKERERTFKSEAGPSCRHVEPTTSPFKKTKDKEAAETSYSYRGMGEPESSSDSDSDEKFLIFLIPHRTCTISDAPAVKYVCFSSYYPYSIYP